MVFAGRKGHATDRPGHDIGQATASRAEDVCPTPGDGVGKAKDLGRNQVRILITGAAGFIGKKLTRSLLERPDGTGELVLVDQVAQEAPPSSPGGVKARVVTADLAAAAAELDGGEFDAVFHLAAVVSAGAEADFDLGYAVNLDGTRLLLEACRRQAKPPAFVFTSSVAVFGGAMPPVVTDDTVARPQSSYGTQKIMGELLVSDFTRKGYVRGLSLRLPTIVVRPGRPNKAASSFASSILREPLQGEGAVCPVARDQALWILSPAQVVEALRRGLRIASEGTEGAGAINLPGLTVTVAEMVEALGRVGGPEAVARVRFEPDAGIQRIVGTWPARFETRRALDLGFAPDSDLDSILRRFVAEDRAPAARS